MENHYVIGENKCLVEAYSKEKIDSELLEYAHKYVYLALNFSPTVSEHYFTGVEPFGAGVSYTVAQIDYSFSSSDRNPFFEYGQVLDPWIGRSLWLMHGDCIRTPQQDSNGKWGQRCDLRINTTLIEGDKQAPDRLFNCRALLIKTPNSMENSKYYFESDEKG